MAATGETTEVKKLALVRLFKDIRGDKARQESDFIDTAIEIDEYLGAHNLLAIEEELTSNNKRFDNHNKQTVGGLLSALLAVKYYQERCHIDNDSDEDRVLQAISTALEVIYDNPKNIDLPDLIAKTKVWIDNYALVSTDTKLAKNMLYSIFTMCKISDLFLENLHSPLKWAISRQININDTRGNLAALMGRLKQLDVDLETKLQGRPINAETVAPTMSNTDDPLPVETTAPPRTASEYLNKRCLESFANPEGDIVQQIGTASGSLEKMSADLTTLIDERRTYDALAAKLVNARTMLELLNDDVKQPHSTFMLLKQNRDPYAAFFNDSDDTQKAQWTEQLDAITPRDTSRIGSVILHVSDYTPTAVSYAASWIGSVLSTVVPTKVTEVARGVREEVSAAQRVPILDTAFKEELKRAASARVECLTRELDASASKIDDVIGQLAPDNPVVQEMIKTTSFDTLSAVRDTNKRTGEILKQCENLSLEIIADRQMINDINAANKGIRAIVDKPRSLRSMIMMWISKIFKLHYEDQIEAAKEMSVKLETIQNDCKAKLNQAVAEINQETTPEPVKASLRSQLDRETRTTHETVRAPRGSLTIFQSLKDQVIKIEEKDAKMKEAANKDNPRP